MMETTQKRLSSGKKVNSALDDPVAYFTAVAHEQRATDLAGRKDEMSEAVQTVKAADAGIENHQDPDRGSQVAGNVRPLMLM